MNLNESTKPIEISGEEKTWDRARLVTINNAYGQTPTLTFTDDRITVSPLGEKHKGLPEIKMDFSDPTKILDLLHPVTDAKIGTFTLQQLQIMLYSLYIYAKNKDTKAN